MDMNQVNFVDFVQYGDEYWFMMASPAINGLPNSAMIALL